MKTDKILYGGDYNPEQWLHMPEILEKDIEYFKKAHINTVTMGMFSWGALEPEEGNYQFDWLEERIQKLYENGISVILSTPSGARPKWLADSYPEVLRVRDDGIRMKFGGRHNHCYTSPFYRKKVQKIDTQLAKRFGNHPGVILWHISNEFGGECHCPLCQDAFRNWLKKKYQTIDNLNEQWNTTFWSHQYQSFEQIEAPSRIGESSLHGLTLDWKRFVTDQTIDFMKAEIEAIHKGGSQRPITTNMMYEYKGLNYAKFSDELDVISWDSYPTWHKGNLADTAQDTGMQHDWFRALKPGVPFLLMESSPSSTNWQPISKLRRPGMIKQAALQAIAHGSDSSLYFQMRQSRGASEKFHGAVIDHYGGCDTRVFEEVTQTGEALERLAEVTGSITKAQAAVLYDTENFWALSGAEGPRNQDLAYKEAAEKCYHGLRRMGLDVDVISAEAEINGYQIVIAPMLYMFREGLAKKVEQFVQAGGTFVMTYWSGVVNENDLCYLGGRPYGLMDVMGFQSMEIDGLYDGEENHFYPMSNNPMGLHKVYTCQRLCELVRIQEDDPDMKVIMVYQDDFYAGAPAVTCHAYGEGKAYGILADVEKEFYEDFIERLVLSMEESLELSIRGPFPEGVEVCRREKENTEYLFIQNFGKNICLLALKEEDFGKPGWEVLYEEKPEDKNRGRNIKLGAGETIVLKRNLPIE